jgi:hypothetical protein
MTFMPEGEADARNLRPDIAKPQHAQSVRGSH